MGHFNSKNMLVGILLFSVSANAQSNSLINAWNQNYLLLGLAITALIILLITCSYVLVLVKYMVNIDLKKQEKPAFGYRIWFFEKFVSGKLVPVGQEESIMLDHNYDGIVELDNKMPPWLKLLFLFTIGFAIVYVSMYLVTDFGALQLEEYANENTIAEKQKEQRNLLAANSIDETSVKLETGSQAVEEGKAIYLQNCKACHGAFGEGGVGPNLTDPFWIHGGTINEVFKTVKYGVPQKGMIAWQTKLNPLQMQKVSSFILSIQATNPPNGKLPQGEKVAMK